MAIVEMGFSRYPCSPLLADAVQSGNRTTMIAAGTGMQVAALCTLADSFRIGVRLEAEITAVARG